MRSFLVSFVPAMADGFNLSRKILHHSSDPRLTCLGHTYGSKVKDANHSGRENLGDGVLSFMSCFASRKVRPSYREIVIEADKARNM